MGMDIYGRNEPTYFRANLWGWRPIHAISALAIDRYNLNLSTEGWGYNDGNGLDNQEECNQLATAIMRMITEDNEMFKPDDDIIYVNVGMWVTNDGQFISSEDEKELNDNYPDACILKSGVVTSKGVLVQPAHSTSMDRIKEWVAFLRECGGFQIF